MLIGIDFSIRNCGIVALNKSNDIHFIIDVKTGNNLKSTESEVRLFVQDLTDKIKTTLPALDETISLYIDYYKNPFRGRFKQFRLESYQTGLLVGMMSMYEQLKVHLVTPQEVRKHFNLSAKAKKIEVWSAVGIDTNTTYSEHVKDAIALVRYGLEKEGM